MNSFVCLCLVILASDYYITGSDGRRKMISDLFSFNKPVIKGNGGKGPVESILANDPDTYVKNNWFAEQTMNYIKEEGLPPLAKPATTENEIENNQGSSKDEESKIPLDIPIKPPGFQTSNILSGLSTFLQAGKTCEGDPIACAYTIGGNGPPSEGDTPNADDFAQQFFKCATTAAQCALLKPPPVGCLERCMLDLNPITSGKIHVILNLIEQLCSPQGTPFGDMVPLMESMVEKTSSPNQLKDLADMLKLGALRLKGFAASAANSLQVALLKHSQELNSCPLNYVLDSIDFALNKMSTDTFQLKFSSVLDEGIPKKKSNAIVSLIRNGACDSINKGTVVRRFIDGLGKNPLVIDTILGGYDFSSTVAGLFDQGKVPSMITAFKQLVHITMNRTCGLISYAETGSSGECFEKEDTADKEPTHLQEDSNVFIGACKTIPEFPSFALNLGFKLPKDGTE